MRNELIISIGAASFLLLTVQGVLADCRSENAACVSGARSPFDSVACGSMFRSCAAHAANAAQQNANDKKHSTSVIVKSPSMPSGGGGRKGK